MKTIKIEKDEENPKRSKLIYSDHKASSSCAKKK